MSLFGLATEIRLKIFSDLLILSEPIVFVPDHGPSLRLFRSGGGERLYPELLRTNKQAYREASPLLYSHNRFVFPDISASTPPAADGALIAPFVRQIGSQASLIRHICLSFPAFEDYQQKGARLHDAQIKNLELIRDACTGITALELALPVDLADYALLGGSPTAAEALDLFNRRFKDISSLQKVIVNLQVRGGEDLGDLEKKVGDCGWTVEITKLARKVWISNDGRVEFDDEGDCDAYNTEQCCLEWQRQEEEEKESWKEEYHRRRRDPCWKNDSDYD